MDRRSSGCIGLVGEDMIGTREFSTAGTDHHGRAPPEGLVSVEEFGRIEQRPLDVREGAFALPVRLRQAYVLFEHAGFFRRRTPRKSDEKQTFELGARGNTLEQDVEVARDLFLVLGVIGAIDGSSPVREFAVEEQEHLKHRALKLRALLIFIDAEPALERLARRGVDIARCDLRLSAGWGRLRSGGTKDGSSDGFRREGGGRARSKNSRATRPRRYRRGLLRRLFAGRRRSERSARMRRRRS